MQFVHNGVIMGKHQHIYLQVDERAELEKMCRTGIESARVIGRAKALLLLDRSQGEKRTISQVAEASMLSKGTISNRKRRYLAESLPGALYDKPRPGAKRKIDGEVEAHLIAVACSEPPEGCERWTLRLLADRLVALEVVDSISHVAVGNALKKTNSSLGE